MILLLFPDGGNKTFSRTSAIHTPSSKASLFSGMRGSKEMKFHSETFDSGHSLVSDIWMTFVCLLLVGRDSMIHVNTAQVRRWRMTSRVTDIILLGAEGFLKGAWWSLRNVSMLHFVFNGVSWISVTIISGQVTTTTVIIFGGMKGRNEFSVWGLLLQST